MTMQQLNQPPWSLEDVRDILAGTVDPARSRITDRKGLSPVAFAALKAATVTDSLLPLLELLEPPGDEEKGKLDVLLELLERIAEGQVVLGQRLAIIESTLAGRSGASRAGSPASDRRASDI